MQASPQQRLTLVQKRVFEPDRGQQSKRDTRVQIDYVRFSPPKNKETKSTGLQRLRACLKLQVLLRQRATNYRAPLLKMTYEDKAFYDSTPPCSLSLSDLSDGSVDHQTNLTSEFKQDITKSPSTPPLSL